jgi:hypothetical protein
MKTEYGNIRIRKIGDHWYVYEWDAYHGQCLSLGAANPPGGGRWFANGQGDWAVQYVGRAYSTLAAAQRYART